MPSLEALISNFKSMLENLFATSLKNLLTSDTVPSTGGTFQVTVGTSSTALTSQQVRSVTIKADSNNTDDVWVGFSSSIDPSTGFQLSAGESLDLVIDDLSKIYVVSPTDGQKIYVIWVL